MLQISTDQSQVSRWKTTRTSVACQKKGRGNASPPPRLHQFVTLFRTVTPGRYRLLNRCALRTKRIVCYGLLQALVDLRLLCTFHLNQVNGAFCDTEDGMVNIDIGSWHFDLEFCHGRTTRGHHSGLDVLQWRCGRLEQRAAPCSRPLRFHAAW